jgi:ABC-2 type transport system permease protein
MARWLLNVALLCRKEFRSLLMDTPLMALILFAFTVGIYAVAKGVKAEVSNASIAVLDGDHSELSRRLRYAIHLPYFKAPEDIERADIQDALDKDRYIFVVEFPPRFEVDVLALRRPSVQVLVDATAMTQAGLGADYLEEIFSKQAIEFLQSRGIDADLPLKVKTRIQFNPNAESAWYTSVMQIVTNITVLAIVLVGAAVIREREHGTIEHLLVMPVRSSEIAVAKIVTNGLVIHLAALASLLLVAHLWLGVPIAGSLALFSLAAALYLFSVTALGVFMATLTTSMPQFGLLTVPVYTIAYLLSGAATPVDSMPLALQPVANLLPTTQFVDIAQAVLYRDAGFDVIWPKLAALTVTGSLFLAFALARFRSMLERVG